MIFNQHNPFNSACGISVELGKEELRISACKIHLHKNILSFDKKLSYSGSLKQLSGKLPENEVIALNIYGKGILHKKITKVFAITPANFSDILPNANFDEFYIQNFISGDYSFVSAIRKTIADELIGQLTQIGFKVMTLTIGPFVVHQVLDQMNQYDNELSFDGHKIIFDDSHNWLSYQHHTSNIARFPLKVESEILTEDLLIPYAAAFQLLMIAKIYVLTVNAPLLEQYLARAIELQKSKNIGTKAIIAIFLVMLINLQVIAYLTTDNQKLTEQISLRSQNVVNFQDLQNQIIKKESLIKALGWDNGVSKGSLTDRLAALLPPDLTWFKITINPVDITGSRIRKSLVFVNNQIWVQGTSQRIVPVNEWIARVKAQSWVKSADLEDYRYNNEKNTGEFTVIINY